MMPSSDRSFMGLLAADLDIRKMAHPGRDGLGGNSDHARPAPDKNPVLLDWSFRKPLLRPWCHSLHAGNWLYRDPAVHQHGLTADKAAFG